MKEGPSFQPSYLLIGVTIIRKMVTPFPQFPIITLWDLFKQTCLSPLIH